MQLGVARSLERGRVWARRARATTHASHQAPGIYIRDTIRLVCAAMVVAMMLGSSDYGASLGFR